MLYAYCYLYVLASFNSNDVLLSMNRERHIKYSAKFPRETSDFLMHHYYIIYIFIFRHPISITEFHIDLIINTGKVRCHSLCLGDCWNSTAAGCHVCRGNRYNGVCVEKCPDGTYSIKNRMECVTEEYCRKLHRYPIDGKCWSSCPHGTKSDGNGTCIACAECINECYDRNIDSMSMISSLHGCHWYMGDLTITLQRGTPNTMELLTQSFADLQVINGSLKIHRSSALTSLSFLQNLHTITGSTLWPGNFALIITNNDNLQDLWHVANDTELNINAGNLLIAHNSNLCLSKIHSFQDQIVQKTRNDIIDVNSNGYEHVCMSKVIETSVTGVTHNNATISWSRFEVTELQRVVAYLIHYIEVPHQNESFVMNHNIPDTCTRYFDFLFLTLT